MRRAKQAVVASAVGLAMLATPLTLPNLGGSAGSAEDAEVGLNAREMMKKQSNSIDLNLIKQNPF
ncbi:hypothetical protein [Priestia megaterium]|uniref:hypothetical protein n=1 Tax=Priestia megaterium TaxID=1404 RepID=UPI001FD8269D|nr:hypothetical protein [Priestia megaterium]